MVRSGIEKEVKQKLGCGCEWRFILWIKWLTNSPQGMFERTSQVDIWEKSILGRENCKSQVQRWEQPGKLREQQGPAPLVWPEQGKHSWRWGQRADQRPDRAGPFRHSKDISFYLKWGRSHWKFWAKEYHGLTCYDRMSVAVVWRNHVRGKDTMRTRAHMRVFLSQQ